MTERILNEDGSVIINGKFTSREAIQDMLLWAGITQVVNIRNDMFDVKICRKRDNTIPDYPEEGWAGNPFILKNANDDIERDRVCEQYEKYFYKRLEEDENFKNGILSLKGKRLACFCKPKRCHGDTIANYLNNLG